MGGAPNELPTWALVNYQYIPSNKADIVIRQQYHSYVRELGTKLNLKWLNMFPKGLEQVYGPPTKRGTSYLWNTLYWQLLTKFAMEYESWLAMLNDKIT